MSITKYEEEGQVFYKVYVHIRSKKNYSKRFQKTILRLGSEAEARKEEKKLIRELSTQAQKHDGLGLTWEEVVHLWLQEYKAGYMGTISKRTFDGYVSIIDKWTQRWNSVPAAELSRADARQLLERLKKQNLSFTYIKKVKNTINKVYEWGMEYGYIIGVKISPLKGLVLERTEERAPDILSLEEIKKLLSLAKALNHQWYPVWAFAILTGMRSGELHALIWQQIDLEKKTIMVDRAYDSNLKSQGPTKGRYWRTIPINDSLQRLIIDLKNSPSSHGEFVLPRIKDWDNGDQAVPLKNFLNSINVKPIKFHALRACFATQMLASGVPSPIVMKIGGWKKSATMDIYLRLAGVDTKGATDCLQFIPDEITFGENVVSLSSRRGE
jgi:integrase